MVLESTMICFDNSDYMRNGDYNPTRLNVQKEAVDLICSTKIRSNPENHVGLMTFARDMQRSKNVEVLATFTNDVGRIFTKLHAIQPRGDIDFIIGIRIAQLALKHRQGKNHKMRIIIFVGSPMNCEQNELIKLGKRLKKEKVNVDVVAFGGLTQNNKLLTEFINAVNGKETSGSHIINVPCGSPLTEALLSSPVLQGGEDLPASGARDSFDFGIDPSIDPELALALRISMAELEAEEQRRAAGNSNNTSDTTNGAGDSASASASTTESAKRNFATLIDEEMPDFENMTEEEQFAYAMQMSLGSVADESDTQPAKRFKYDNSSNMDVDETTQTDASPDGNGDGDASTSKDKCKNKTPDDQK